MNVERGGAVRGLTGAVTPTYVTDCDCRCHFDFVLCANLAMCLLLSCPVGVQVLWSSGPWPHPLATLHCPYKHPVSSVPQTVVSLYTWLRPKMSLDSTYISFTNIFARRVRCSASPMLL